MTLCIGAIADDYTGATDLAVTLVKEGMRVLQLFGVPDGPVDLSAVDGVVIALKSRTQPVGDAVTGSLAACDWLCASGARQILFKYCSTFDSTPAGNIGPVADALLDRMRAKIAVVCPAFPANHRSVYMGHLFVGDRLLAESPMKDHPLTPMTDSDLVRLMAAQSQHEVGLIPLATVRAGVGAIEDRLAALGTRYAVADAVAEQNLRDLGAALDGHALVTGGSGIAMGLPANFGFAPGSQGADMPRGTGRAAVLAGSCSTATRAQIAHVAPHWPCHQLDVEALANGADVARAALDWAAAQSGDQPVLIYASADPAEVTALQQRHGRDRVGHLVEDCFAHIARGLVAAGTGRMIVAGGETSGAVVGGLGIDALRIHGEIDPGVPWTQTQGTPPLALALKSGNFGTTDFFVKAFEVLE